MGIEPTRPAWKAGTLPLSYTRTAINKAKKYYHIKKALSIIFWNFDKLVDFIFGFLVQVQI